MHPNPLSAAVFERDWKTPGDGLLTYDDLNNREWLDLTAQLSIPTPRYDNVVAELGPGGLFDGFVVGGRDDVVALAESAGIVIGTMSIDVNGGPVNHFIDLLGTVGSSDIGNRRSFGQVIETFPFEPMPAHVAVDVSISPLNQRAGLTILAARSDAFPNENLPVFLYRNAVPEPGTMFGACCIMSGLIIRPRKRLGLLR